VNEAPDRDRYARYEPLLIFAAFFLPAYLFQSPAGTGELFNSLRFNLAYLAQALPQFFLLLYLIRQKGKQQESDEATMTSADSAEPPGARGLAAFGVVTPTLGVVPWAVVGTLVLLVFLVPLAFVGQLMSSSLPVALADKVKWHLANPAMLPLVFVVCLTAGYNEELYFRSYLLTCLPRLGVPAGGALLVSTLLFAAGHLYQGLAGFLGTGIVGLLLAWFFLKKRNLHVVALAHGLYNFTALLLTLVIPGASW